ncbi:MAG: hypothetical protein ACJ764_14360, partial [Solirubrobacteraceae bacterium]
MSPPQPRPTLHEAAHERPEDRGDQLDSDQSTGTGVRRTLNEAAHKLGNWPVRPEPVEEETPPSAELAAAMNDQRDVVAHAGRLVL